MFTTEPTIERLPRPVGRSAQRVRWDGRKVRYLPDSTGSHMIVFRDTSPYPEHNLATVYGVCREGEEIGFGPTGAPWTTTSLEAAFDFVCG